VRRGGKSSTAPARGVPTVPTTCEAGCVGCTRSLKPGHVLPDAALRGARLTAVLALQPEIEFLGGTVGVPSTDLNLPGAPGPAPREF